MHSFARIQVPVYFDVALDRSKRDDIIKAASLRAWQSLHQSASKLFFLKKKQLRSTLVQTLPCTQRRSLNDVVALGSVKRYIKINGDLNASKAVHSSLPSFVS